MRATSRTTRYEVRRCPKDHPVDCIRSSGSRKHCGRGHDDGVGPWIAVSPAASTAQKLTAITRSSPKIEAQYTGKSASISAGMGKPPSPAMIEKRSMLRRRRAPLSRRKEGHRSWSGLASSILRLLEHAYGLNKGHRALQRAIDRCLPQSYRTRGRLGTFTVPASIRTFDGHGCCRWFSRDPPSRRAQHRCSMQVATARADWRVSRSPVPASAKPSVRARMSVCIVRPPSIRMMRLNVPVAAMPGL
jgi:hypothetical protein